MQLNWVEWAGLLIAALIITGTQFKLINWLRSWID
tara:strand:- start:475 stop:579 length:105 start_codon:yes stop_codon:yes gene_type:complete